MSKYFIQWENADKELNNIVERFFDTRINLRLDGVDFAFIDNSCIDFIPKEYTGIFIQRLKAFYTHIDSALNLDSVYRAHLDEIMRYRKIDEELESETKVRLNTLISKYESMSKTTLKSLLKDYLDISIKARIEDTELQNDLKYNIDEVPAQSAEKRVNVVVGDFGCKVFSTPNLAQNFIQKYKQLYDKKVAFYSTTIDK